MCACVGLVRPASSLQSCRGVVGVGLEGTGSVELHGKAAKKVDRFCTIERHSPAPSHPSPLIPLAAFGEMAGGGGKEGKGWKGGGVKVSRALERSCSMQSIQYSAVP
jgi:hypothetical protein